MSKFAALAATECLAHDLDAVGAPIKRVGRRPCRRRHADRALAPQPTERATPTEAGDDARSSNGALSDLTTTMGAPPSEVAGMIVDAIRNEQFLVPTKPSYADQMRERFDALLAKQLPPMPNFD